jgi:hypothetical protein
MELFGRLFAGFWLLPFLVALENGLDFLRTFIATIIDLSVSLAITTVQQDPC